MTTPQSAIDDWGKEPEPEEDAEEKEAVQIEVQVVPSAETEIEMSSDSHRVRVKSSAPLNEVAATAHALWVEAVADKQPGRTVGFGSQLVERNPQHVRQPGSMPWMPQDL